MRLVACSGRLRRIALVAAIVTVAPASPAAAHSTLIATEPSRDAVVERSPDRVLLRFDEPIETQLGSVRVYDGNGRRVDFGRIVKPAPESVAVAVEADLPGGTYTVAWRVISADSDPINGAWVFHVQRRARSRAESRRECWRATTSRCRRSTSAGASSTSC